MRIAELLVPETLETELSDLVESARVLAGEGGYFLSGSSSLSKKVETTASRKDARTALLVTSPEMYQDGNQRPGFALYDNESLAGVVAGDGEDDRLLPLELCASQLSATDLRLSSNVLLHAVTPFPYVFFTQPDALLALACTYDAEERLGALFGDALLVLPFVSSGPFLARALRDAFASRSTKEMKGIFVMQQGLVCFGATAEEAVESLRDICLRARRYLEEHEAWRLAARPAASGSTVPRQDLAGLRKQLSDAAGHPLILSSSPLANTDPLWSTAPSDLTPLVSLHLPGHRHAPFLLSEPGSFIQEPAAAAGDSAPSILLKPGYGLCVAGATVSEVLTNQDYFSRLLDTVRRARVFGSVTYLAEDAWAKEQRVDALLELHSKRSRPVFTGEVALVTGAASGIGKACASSLLDRGAAVVGLDVSKAIVGLFPTRNFLGIVCDVSDEAAICQAVDEAVRAFGGLDMLVLNAGVFPAGCRIEAMSMVEWTKVIGINLNGNLALMRECAPLLKLAPRHGRVVINGSRNVKAPGPGAAAYSASKAALTQLARVAALEWGKDGIRVNVVHPNAVFDTGLYTEEILKARSASYGITVEQYKKNNVLQVEITSRDVAEMVAEMLGPLFSKVTGAQVSIDGGSDRVI